MDITKEEKLRIAHRIADCEALKLFCVTEEHLNFKLIKLYDEVIQIFKEENKVSSLDDLMNIIKSLCSRRMLRYLLVNDFLLKELWDYAVSEEK